MSPSKSGILESIRQDARRLKVARTLPPEGQPIGDNIARLVKDEFDQFLTVTGLSLADVAKRLGKGCSTSTLSTWRSFLDPKNTKVAEYKGDIDRVTRTLNQFMETYAQQATARRIEGFVETEVAGKMLSVIRETIALRSMALITGDSGRGKTMTLQAAEMVYPGAVYIRCKRRFRTSTGLARLLADALGIKAARNSGDMQLQIIKMLAGTGRVLLIDEAHQLHDDALEFVRDVFDECEIPIVLVGTRKLDENTQDKNVFFGQLASRIAWRLDINSDVRDRHDKPKKPLHSVKDITAMCQSDQVRLTNDGVAMLGRLANIEGKGGLRLCVQIYRVAARIAKARSHDIDARLLLQALREMHDRNIDSARIEQAMDELQVKVA